MEYSFHVYNPLYVNDESNKTERALTPSIIMNRLLVSSLAILLLWCTSLDICIWISNSSVPVPQYEAVSSSCQSAFDASLAQRDESLQCSNIQLDRCFSQLSYSNSVEDIRIGNIQNQNNILVSKFQSLSDSCSATESNIRDLISSWESSNPLVDIYTHSKDCSVAKMGLLNENGFSSTVATSITSASNDYSATSLSSLKDVVDYSIELDNYWTKSMSNFSSLLSEDVKFLMNMSTASLSSLVAENLKKINDDHDMAMSCFSIISTADTGKSCSWTNTSFAESLDGYIMAANNQANILKTEYDFLYNQFLSFEDDVSTALDNAQKFYNIIAGPQGVLTWIVNNAGVFPSLASLCGKTSPDWCDFSIVSYCNCFLIWIQ